MKITAVNYISSDLESELMLDDCSRFANAVDNTKTALLGLGLSEGEATIVLALVVKKAILDALDKELTLMIQ